MITADKLDQRNRHTQELHCRLGVKFIQADCHKLAELVSVLESLLRPALLFCDGGDKELEFQLLCPLLQEGDIVGVHDVGTEFQIERPEILACIREHHLSPLDTVENHIDETRSMYWRRD